MDVGQGVWDPDTVLASRYASKTLENDDFTDYGFWAAGRKREGGCHAHPDFNLPPVGPIYHF